MKYVCLQGAGPNAASKAEPTKRAQTIEPVLRHAPTRKAQHASASSAASLGTSRSSAGLPSDQPARFQPVSSAGAQIQHSSAIAQEALYRQQIQSALRDESPEAQSAASQKRPTAKLPLRKPKALSPAQQAQQDLSERCAVRYHVASLAWQPCNMRYAYGVSARFPVPDSSNFGLLSSSSHVPCT